MRTNTDSRKGSTVSSSFKQKLELVAFEDSPDDWKQLKNNKKLMRERRQRKRSF